MEVDVFEMLDVRREIGLQLRAASVLGNSKTAGKAHELLLNNAANLMVQWAGIRKYCESHI